MTFKEVKNPGCMALNYKLTCSQSVTNITSSCLCYWSSKANKKQNLRQVQNFAKNIFGNKLVQYQLSLINLWPRYRFFQSTILEFLGNDDCMFLMFVIYKSIFSFQPPSTFLSLKLDIFVDFTLIWNSWNFCIFEPFSRFSWGQETKYVYFLMKIFPSKFLKKEKNWQEFSNWFSKEKQIHNLVKNWERLQKQLIFQIFLIETK